MTFKVFIPTAGIGSRLENFSINLNKSLLNVANKPVISHIIEKFPKNTEYIIALGFKGELVKEYISLAHPNIKIKFIKIKNYQGIGSGLSHTMSKSYKYLQDPFIFISCDTIIDQRINFLKSNWIGYSEFNNEGDYRRVKIHKNKIIKIFEKNNFKIGSKPYIGVCSIRDFKTFWKNFHKNKNLLNNNGEVFGLKNLIDNNFSVYAKKFKWHDTGNLVSFEKANESLSTKNQPNILIKQNEQISFVNDRVIKFNADKDFIKKRVKRIKYLKKYVPEIIDFKKNFYTYKKFDGEVLSKILNKKIFIEFLSYTEKFWEKNILTKNDSKNFKKKCKNFYFVKTNKRLSLFYKTFNKIDENTIINGKQIPALSKILKQIDWNYISNGMPVRFHGDFHFENILYSSKNKTFCFIDWRQDFEGILKYGDLYYDLAKLLHGMIIDHELILKNQFKVNWKNNIINYKFNRKKSHISSEALFKQWVEKNNYDWKKILTITALIFLNISPLHHYPYSLLLYSLGKFMIWQVLNEKNEYN